MRKKLILNIIGSNENFVSGFSMNLFLKISMRRNISTSSKILLIKHWQSSEKNWEYFQKYIKSKTVQMCHVFTTLYVPPFSLLSKLKIG